MRKLAPWYALAALVVVLDQLTKYWISASFGHAEVRAVTGFFIGIALVAIVVISVLLARHAGDKLFCLSLALILGGAIGNVLDRVALGYVVDFLDFYVAGWHWPAFNLADSAITAGAVLLVVDSFRPGAGRAGASR